MFYFLYKTLISFDIIGIIIIPKARIEIAFFFKISYQGVQ